MKYIKMDVVRNNEMDYWWYKFHHDEVKRLLIVNESKAPKRHYKLKRGGQR